MLYDIEFLKKLDKNRTKTTYAKIIALSIDETPLETIEGRITQGSVNLDGDSAVRRTCSLTMVAQNFDYSSYLWGLNTKFKLEVGLENNIDPSYPDIIWFKQGTYIISSFNTASSTNNFTITIQGKDKMCALNGEVGGALTSSVDFGTLEEKDINGNLHIIKLPLKDIIRNVVHLYGGEPAHNIIINDLDMSGLELLEYRYNIPMYLYRDINNNTNYYNNATLDGNKQCMVETSHTVDDNGNIIVNGWYAYIDSAKNRYEYVPNTDPPVDTSNLVLNDLNNTEFEMLVSPMIGSSNPSIIKMEGNQYYIAKINYGDTAGYRFTDLTYAGDLIGNVGETLTSILDKIKNMLGEFEYFYNLDGQFVFQKKKTYIQSSWSPEAIDEEGKKYIKDENEVAYHFTNGELITAFNNNPNLSNLKNDFSVWGERAGVSGAAIPVHMRYAIDKKPTKYSSIEVLDTEQNLINYNNKYGTLATGQDTWTYITNNRHYIDEDKKIVYCDWREIIYQMAQDYYRYAHILDDFEQRIISMNPQYFTGKTGYENYYIDLIRFWRDLYDMDLNENGYDKTSEEIERKKEDIKIKETEVQTKIEELEIEKGKENNDANIKNTEEKLSISKAELSKLNQELIKLEATLNRYENYFWKEADLYRYWNKTVYEHPENLNFWFDFLDSEGELSQFSVKNVGCRPKAINDSNVKAIYFRETPDVIFSQNIIEDKQKSSAYTYIQIPLAYENAMFSISAQGKSAKQEIDNLLYKHSYCIENATITTIPIYYLEPNTKIYIQDEKTKLNGYYAMSKLSIPLTYNGTMSITATRAADLNI